LSEGKIGKVGTVPCNLTELVKAASHYCSVENHAKVNKSMMGISYYVQTTNVEELPFKANSKDLAFEASSKAKNLIL